MVGFCNCHKIKPCLPEELAVSFNGLCGKFTKICKLDITQPRSQGLFPGQGAGTRLDVINIGLGQLGCIIFIST